MAGSVFITLKTSDSDVAKRVTNAVSGKRMECLVDVRNQVQAALGRTSNDTVDVQYNTTVAAVNASSTVTLTYASVANNDTVTVAGTTLTCVTGTPSGAQFKKEVDGTTTAANLAALINSNTTLNKVVRASSAAAVVTVTCLVPGTIGNLVTLATSNATGFALSAAALANGAGGPTAVAVSF